MGSIIERQPGAVGRGTPYHMSINQGPVPVEVCSPTCHYLV
ncbi:hypothetical protein CGRA01v4_11521 [Colletotrichum graminicola]|nr:hypothetical protein CGRA01v4_11521 [Colletotrichum graminicola]